MNYPLQISFKVIALAHQMAITDSNENLVAYVKQKLFKIKEAVTVFADREQTRPIYTIQADRILDISAKYNFSDAQGNPVGAVKRRGMKSLLKAHYDILEGEREVLSIQEENPWVKVLDAVLGEIPVLGMFTGYMFHPAYLVRRPDGTLVMRLVKKPAFFEGKFDIEQKGEFQGNEERLVLLSLIMLVLLERRRG